MRWNYSKLSHDALKPLNDLGSMLKRSSLGQKLIDLVNLRASQMNACAFCVDMHVKEMRLHGESELRMHHVTIWRESPLFDPRERAALEWVEALTRLDPSDPVPDRIFEKVRAQLTEQEVSDLTFAVGVINLWNRVAISSRAVPGSLDKALGLDRAGL